MSQHGARSRYNAQRDQNEQPIVDTLEARGYHVTKINGNGVPDLLIAKHGTVWLVEVKQPKAKLKPSQVKWQEKWQGPKVIVLRSVEDAVRFPETEGK